MVRHCSPKLTNSTVYLTDSPYDVQLGVLKFIRCLMSEVVNEVVSRPSTATGSAQGELRQRGGGDGDGGGGNGKASLLPGDGKREEKEWPQGQAREGGHGGGEGSYKSTKITTALELDAESGRPTGNDDDAGAADGDESGGRTPADQKRSRMTTLHGRQPFGPGCVVECFHPDDGLWYPATITAVIPRPPAVHSEEVKFEGLSAKDVPKESTQEASKAPKEGTSLTLPAAPPSPSTSDSTAQQPVDSDLDAASLEAVGFALSSPTGRREGDNGVHNFVRVGELTATTAATAAADLKFMARDNNATPMLEVTFLGYGNQSRVPQDWAREIVTPEVLQWCKVNGIEAASVGMEGDENIIFEPAVSEGSEDELTATATPVMASAMSTDITESGSDNQPSETSGRGAANREAGANGAKKGQLLPRKRKKHKKNKKNHSIYRNNSKGGEKRQVGTAEEEEERFLMRCASRSKSPYPHVPDKYWGQRYRYFSRFDEGVSLDEEGWYSVTPEAIALHIAERVCCDVVVDPFVGCGGNAVQFALVSHMVFAIDIEPIRLEHARRNAAIYGVENRIEFILGDAMKVLPTLKADAVFLSPPWGGPGYRDSKTFDLNSMIPPPLTALEIFRAARAVTPNVVFFLPRNVDSGQVAGLPAAAAAAAAAADTASEAGVGRASKSEGMRQGRDDLVASFDDTCELEKQFLNGKLKTTTAYFGKDIAISARKKQVSDSFTEPSGSAGVVEAPSLQEGSSDWNGDDGKEGEAWSGRHVRFSDNGDDGVDGVQAARICDGSSGQDVPPSISSKRENALYDAWMTE